MRAGDDQDKGSQCHSVAIIHAQARRNECYVRVASFSSVEQGSGIFNSVSTASTAG